MAGEDVGHRLEETPPRGQNLAPRIGWIFSMLADAQNAIDPDLLAAQSDGRLDVVVDGEVEALRQVPAHVTLVDLIDVHRYDPHPRPILAVVVVSFEHLAHDHVGVGMAAILRDDSSD